MTPQLKDRVDPGLLVLRVGIGLMFALLHGLPKLVGGVSMWKGLGGAFNRLLGVVCVPAFWGFLASLSECGGGICLILGVCFRPACALILFTLVIAVASIIRGGYGFDSVSHLVELAVVLLSLLFTGPGRLTLRNILATWKASG